MRTLEKDGEKVMATLKDVIGVLIIPPGIEWVAPGGGLTERSEYPGVTEGTAIHWTVGWENKEEKRLVCVPHFISISPILFEKRVAITVNYWEGGLFVPIEKLKESERKKVFRLVGREGQVVQLWPKEMRAF